MKIRLYMKSPDAISNAVRKAAEEQVEKELEMLIDNKEREIRDAISNWIEWGEYITVEIDTEKDTAMVVRVK